MIIKAVQLINKGARLVGTNPDMTGPSEMGIIPACQALVAPISLATGKTPYFVGKPNPLMMRTGLKMLNVHSADAVMIGDRMDTDIVAGMESGLIGLRLRRTEQVGARSLPDRRFLQRSGRILRHEDSHLRFGPHSQRGQIRIQHCSQEAFTTRRMEK